MCSTLSRHANIGTSFPHLMCMCYCCDISIQVDIKRYFLFFSLWQPLALASELSEALSSWQPTEAIPTWKQKYIDILKTR